MKLISLTETNLSIYRSLNFVAINVSVIFGRMFRFETISILIPAMLQECLIQAINHTRIRLTARFSRHVTAQLGSVRPSGDGRRSGDRACQIQRTTIPCPTNELVLHLSRARFLAPHWSTFRQSRHAVMLVTSQPREYTTHGACPETYFPFDRLPSVWPNKNLLRIKFNHAWI